MARRKHAVRPNSTSKAAAAATLGAAGLGLSLTGGASASTLPAADTTQIDNSLASQRFVLGEEEMADVGLATFHLFDREEGTAGLTQVAWRGCRCGGCRGCGLRACRCGGCRGCSGCCRRWGHCRWC
jgi:hypothetical protein